MPPRGILEAYHKMAGENGLQRKHFFNFPFHQRLAYSVSRYLLGPLIMSFEYSYCLTHGTNFAERSGHVVSTTYFIKFTNRKTEALSHQHAGFMLLFNAA